jgi:hypothetical protein
MLAGEGIGASRHIELVQRDADTLDRAARIEGRTVVAVEDAVRSLRGSGFEFVPLPLLNWPTPALVPSGRRDRFVIIAVQPEALRSLAMMAPDLAKRFGGTWIADARARRYVFLMTVSMSCAAIGDRQWHDLSRVACRQVLLRLNNYRAYEGGGVIRSPLASRLRASLRGHGGNAWPLTHWPTPHSSRRVTCRGSTYA